MGAMVRVHAPLSIFLFTYHELPLGTGAMVSPLASTQFAHTKHWRFFYFISSGLAFTSLLSARYIFQLKRLEGESTIHKAPDAV